MATPESSGARGRLSDGLGSSFWAQLALASRSPSRAAVRSAFGSRPLGLLPETVTSVQTDVVFSCSSAVSAFGLSRRGEGPSGPDPSPRTRLNRLGVIQPRAGEVGAHFGGCSGRRHSHDRPRDEESRGFGSDTEDRIRRSLLQRVLPRWFSCRSGTAGTSVPVFAAGASTVGVKGASLEHRWGWSYSCDRRWSERSTLPWPDRRGGSSRDRRSHCKRKSTSFPTLDLSSFRGAAREGRFGELPPFGVVGIRAFIDRWGDPEVDGIRWFECITKAPLICAGRAAMVATPSFAGRQSLRGRGRVQSETAGLRACSATRRRACLHCVSLGEGGFRPARVWGCAVFGSARSLLVNMLGRHERGNTSVAPNTCFDVQLFVLCLDRTAEVVSDVSSGTSARVADHRATPGFERSDTVLRFRTCPVSS